MGSGGGKQTVGYRYHLGFRVVLGHGPIDSLLRITYDDREVWSGNLTASGAIDVNKPDLMGGEGREGGIVGRFSVAFGEASQGVNAYLQSVLGGVVPAFRHKCSVIAEQIYYGTNPYLKEFAWQPQRALSREVTWYDAKADINGHMNPAHMIVDAITSRKFGAGLPVSAIDDARFRAAADTLHGEGFGLSVFWTFGREPDAVPKFVQAVLDHIGGTLFPDPQTGLIRLELHRGGYDVGTLPLFDDSNSELFDYETGHLADTINEVVVTYTRPDTDQPATVSAQNIGNVNAQGRVVSHAVEYPMIQDDTLAARVLDRDLRALSTPLDVARLEVDRTGWDLYPGRVIRVTSAKLGITEGVFRVAHIEEPGLEAAPKLSVRIVQDVFGLSAGSYVVRQPSAWVDPVQPVADLATVLLAEIPYYHLALNLRPADLEALLPDYGFVQAFAPRDEQSWYSFDLHYSPDNITYAAEPLASGTFGPVLQLGAGIGRLDTLLTIASATDPQLVAVGQYGVLIEGAVEEMVEITAWNPTTLATTIKRAVMDSVPRTFTAAARLFVTSFPGAADNTERTDAETAWYKALPRNRDGVLALGSATGRSLTLANRASRPYPPGNLRVNTQYYPASIGTTDQLTLAWAHRDRILQTAGLTTWTSGNIGPEPGTTYTLRLYNELAALVRTETGLTGTSYTWTTEAADSGLTGTYSEDTFDTDSTGSYTQHADTTATWAVSGGELVATGGMQALFVRNGTSFVDTKIECDCNHAYNGGVVLRVQDVNNYYMLTLSDDSGRHPGSNFRLFKRVGGTFTQLASANLSWTRGDSKNIRFEIAGSSLKGFFDGALVISATDSAIASAGGVGMRNNEGGSNQSKYQAFRWDIQDRLNDSLRFELESLRDGLTSRHYHNVTVTRDPPPSGA